MVCAAALPVARDIAEARWAAAPAVPLSIAGIGIGLPALRQSLEDAAPSLGLGPVELRMFRRLFGLKTFPFDAGMPLGRLIGVALADLNRRQPDFQARIRHVFHCHTIPAVVPLGRPFAGGGIDVTSLESASLTMSHCATGLSALAFADVLVDREDAALILIGEKAFHRRIRLIADTTIMGEAAVALFVSRRKGLLEVLGTRTDHDGTSAISRGHQTEDMELGRDYTDFVVAHIEAAVAQFGCGLEAVDLVLPHNVNTISWVGIARKLGLPIERLFLENVSRLGHCFGADPFINATDAIAIGRAGPGSLMLMVSVGMGLSAASALVRVTQISSNSEHDREPSQ